MARDLPRVKESMREDVPGVGTFALQSVGNTAHSTAVHVYLRPERSEAVCRGALDFKLAITPDFRFEWYHDGTAGAWNRNEKVFTDEQVAAGLALMQTYDKRDEISFMFLALSAAEMEIEKKRRQIDDLDRFKDVLDKASAGLITTAWKADELPVRLERTNARIQVFHEENDIRLERLQGLVKAIRDWTYRPPGRRPILEVMQEALASKAPTPSMAM